MLWVAVALGAVILLVAALVLKKKPAAAKAATPSMAATPSKTAVALIEDDAEVPQPNWEWSKAPDSFPKDGPAQIAPYIERLVASRAWYTCLIAFTPDGRRGLALDKQDGTVSLDLVFESGNEAEGRARSLFETRGYQPSHDFISDARRYLSWPLEPGTEVVSEVCLEVLRSVCEIADADGLDICFEEHAKAPERQPV